MAVVAAFDGPMMQPYKQHPLDPTDFMNRQNSETSTHASCDSMTMSSTTAYFDSMTTETSEEITSSEKVNLTEAQVLSLLRELLESFSTPEFQEAMQSMTSNSAHPGHMQLALKVQRRVLPKYRLPGTSDGVLMMLTEVAPFLGNWMVGYLIEKIDETLGLPEGTSRSACIDLQNLDEGDKLASEDVSSHLHASLSRMQVISMASELLDGFSSEGFQQELQELLRKKRSAREVPGRMELALTVQSKVLPKYGFPGTFHGVIMMLDAISPFMDDWMVQHLLYSIDVKLGMNTE